MNRSRANRRIIVVVALGALVVVGRTRPRADHGVVGGRQR